METLLRQVHSKQYMVKYTKLQTFRIAKIYEGPMTKSNMPSY